MEDYIYLYETYDHLKEMLEVMLKQIPKVRVEVANSPGELEKLIDLDANPKAIVIGYLVDLPVDLNRLNTKSKIYLFGSEEYRGRRGNITFYQKPYTNELIDAIKRQLKRK